MSGAHADERLARVRPGQVVKYAPDPSRHDPRWCREGVAVSDESGRYVDTYWGSGSDAHILNAAECVTAEHLFWVDEFVEIERYGDGRNPPLRWLERHPQDRARITSQHGLQARYFLRLGSSPDLATRIENASAALDEADHQLRTAKWRRDSAEMALRALHNEADERNGAPS